ncbi:MAG TPA: bifunctional acetate--CoA ligase family protein/GNAT family N-acetyltransferase, partial [Caldimonas sp.]
GASDRDRSIGALVLRNLKDAGFAGPIWPVSLSHATVGGMPAAQRVALLPEVPDLAVICTPAPTVPGLIAELGAHGTRAAIVLTAGLKASRQAGGPSLEAEMLAAARPHLVRILGPNCLGLLVPGVCLNASFAPAAARPGSLAFLSQSGALATALLDWANSRGIGFSHFVSLGDSADVDLGDLLDYLAADAETRAILLYVESVAAARKFMSAARAAARNKPVLIVKSGRAPEGARAAASHTGALAGSDAVFDAAIRRAGMLRVDTMADLFDAAETLARAKPLRGERLAIVTNGGGAGVLAADALALGGGALTRFEASTLAALDASLPATWSHANPVDLIGDAPIERYVAALHAVLDAPETDAVLFMHAPTAVVPAADIAAACLPLLRASEKPVLTCWLGGDAVAAASAACEDARVATFETPERAVAGFLQLLNYRRNQEALLQTPPSRLPGPPADSAAARAIVERALAEGREMLEEQEVRSLLGAYGIAQVESRPALDPEAAAAAAAEIGFPVVLKILSPQISHKSDVGGVTLDLRSVEAVQRAALEMHARIAALRPDAALHGYTVQAMVVRPHAHELIVGVADDPIFGPVILFGAGGTAVEVLRDRAVALPPLNAVLAQDLISRTRVARLLAGYRDRAPADAEALIASLLQVSQLACDLPEVAEMDINPLLADDHGVIALDARVRVRAVAAGVSRLAIRPYPTELEERIELASGTILLRPIRPEDEPKLRAFYAGASPADMRLRFFMVRREVPHSELARYSQIDYDREMTFIALEDGATDDRLLGEARALCDPDNVRAEFAIQVATEWQGRGLGRALLTKLMRYLRAQGTREVVGECLPENPGMVHLARELDFETHYAAETGSVALRCTLR